MGRREVSSGYAGRLTRGDARVVPGAAGARGGWHGSGGFSPRTAGGSRTGGRRPVPLNSAAAAPAAARPGETAMGGVSLVRGENRQTHATHPRHVQAHVRVYVRERRDARIRPQALRPARSRHAHTRIARGQRAVARRFSRALAPRRRRWFLRPQLCRPPRCPDSTAPAAPFFHTHFSRARENPAAPRHAGPARHDAYFTTSSFGRFFWAALPAPSPLAAAPGDASCGGGGSFSPSENTMPSPVSRA